METVFTLLNAHRCFNFARAIWGDRMCLLTQERFCALPHTPIHVYRVSSVFKSICYPFIWSRWDSVCHLEIKCVTLKFVTLKCVCVCVMREMKKQNVWAKDKVGKKNASEKRLQQKMRICVKCVKFTIGVSLFFICLCETAFSAAKCWLFGNKRKLKSTHVCNAIFAISTINWIVYSPWVVVQLSDRKVAQIHYTIQGFLFSSRPIYIEPWVMI